MEQEKNLDKKEIQPQDKSDEVLSEEELDKVAGGINILGITDMGITDTGITDTGKRTHGKLI